MRIIPTMAIARAAGADAANRQMRREGRTEWNQADYDLACETMQRIMEMI